MHDPTHSFRRAARIALALAGFLPATGQACSADPFVGDICVVAMDYCPPGHVIADGRLLGIQQYTTLAVVLGMRGGDGRTTFAIPDLRGRIPVGTGQGAELDPVAWMQPLGQQTVVLNAAQAPMAGHTHAAAFTPSSSAVSVDIPATPATLDVAVSLPVATASGTDTAPPATGAYLAGMSGTFSGRNATFQGPYITQKPAVPYASKLVANVTVGGAAATTAGTVNVDMVNGGTIAVKPAAAAPAAAPVPTQSPALGLTICIAYQGYYPIHD